jgi:hypothetical protein
LRGAKRRSNQGRRSKEELDCFASLAKRQAGRKSNANCAVHAAKIVGAIRFAIAPYALPS